MRGILSLVVIAVAVLCSVARSAPNGIEAEISIYQLDRTATDKNVLLFRDSVTFMRGVRAGGFFIGFSLEVELEQCDTADATFSVHVVTLKEKADTYAEHYRVEYGVPARRTGIAGKNDASYTLSIMAIKPITIDTSTCKAIHYKKDDFFANPSKSADIFYVPQSLGDYYWGLAKGLLEDRSEAFNKVTGFSSPGKTQVFLCPCKIHSFIWDSRFGTAIDPTRNVAAGIYTKWFNSADPFLLNQVAILRNYGYAPPFLSEGFANYLTMASYDLKLIRRAGKMIALDSMLSTYDYFRVEPKFADRASASFVRYLVDAYTLDRFQKLYRMADDLTLRATLEREYGKPVSELEQEWMHYIDTVTFTEMSFLEHAEEAEALFDYPRMLKYSLEAIPLAASAPETTFTLSQAVLACFYSGDYYRATSFQKQVAERDPASVPSWMGLASYQMMNGYYDSAAASLQRAQNLDSTNALIKFNVALNRLYAGDTRGARVILESAVAAAGENAVYAESRIMLASILLSTRDSADRIAAIVYCQDATSLLQRKVAEQSTNPIGITWLGIGYLCQGDLAKSKDYLELADLIETRPFYQGMIWLWLGKAADVHRERELARRYYGQVLGTASAAYHQQEARLLLETPFRR